jgi:acetyl esterase/lipase
VKPAVSLVALAAAVTLLLAGPPDAEADSRYLDEVFSSVDVTSNIAYGQAIDEFGQPETLLLDLYQPAGDTLPDRPVVIFVHGGGFTGGSKTSPDGVAYARSMARRGFVSASINYRLREDGFPPEELPQVVFDAKHDAQAAVRWFRANAAIYDIDSDRISIAGYSAGAATALFAGYVADDPGESGNPGYPSDVSAVIEISGSMGGFADLLMDAGEPPVLIVHGTADATVPYSAATELVDAAGVDGIPFELHALTDVGHGKFGLLTDEIEEWSGVFVYNHVIAGSPVGGVTELAGDERGAWRPGSLAVLMAGLLALAGLAAMRRRLKAARPSARRP